MKISAKETDTGKINPPPHAHPFVAVMYRKRGERDQLQGIMQERFGRLLGCGPEYRVAEFTDYYRREFGDQLQKQFWVFSTPLEMENFHRHKVWSNSIEGPEDRKQRTANIDPGYLAPSKLVLFSTKNFSHRVYLGNGIYGEVTLLYEHGKFRFLPWTYPDYQWEENVRFLWQMRSQIVAMARR